MMGKSRQKRFGSLRPNPTGISAGDANIDLEIGADSGGNTPAVISNIMEKVQAAGTEERACGCKILANIVSQPSAIGHLLNQNVVKIVAPLFLDKCLDVRKSALGALKNMSVYGQEDVCDIMVSQDVLTPLAVIIKEYGNNWEPPKEATKYDTSTDVLLESVELMANLCESSAKAVQWFNKENLLRILLLFVKVETHGYPLANAVARCLFVVSENNPEVSSVCNSPAVLSELHAAIAVKNPGIDNTLFRILITGILLNLPEIDISQYYKTVVSSIADALEMELTLALESALDGQQQTDEEMNYDPELTWPAVDKLLSAQGVSLELLANICCSEGDWEDEEWEESSDDQCADGAVQDVEMAGDAPENLCLSSELNSALLEQTVMAKVMKIAKPFESELVKRLEGTQCGKTTLVKLSQLRQRALLCLGNLIEVVDESFLSQYMTLPQMWGELYQLAQSEATGSVVVEEDMKWAVTCALRAVIQRLALLQPTSPCDISAANLDFLVGLAIDSKNREVQINVVRILSTIGCMMSSQSQLNELFKKICVTLLEVATQNPDVVIVAEALDSLFDVFKEDHTDPIAVEIQLVDKLKNLQPSYKSKVASQKKKLGENSGVVMMAKTNLHGFIKYKLSQR